MTKDEKIDLIFGTVHTAGIAVFTVCVIASIIGSVHHFRQLWKETHGQDPGRTYLSRKLP